MAYIAPIHRPSSVRHACQLKLLEKDRDCLVLAMANRLEIWALEKNEQDGHFVLAKKHSRTVHGTISMLQKLCPRDSKTEILFIGTDRFQYCTLAWNPETASLKTLDKWNDVGEKHLRDSQSQDKCMVDPSGKFMGMLLWEGVLNVLKLKERGRTSFTEWLGQVRLSELFIRSATFMHSETGHPKIAFLYQSRADLSETKLVTYRLTADDRNNEAGNFNPTKDRELVMDIPDPGASIMIPVEKVEEEKRHNVRNPSMAKPQLGGLLVVGETRLLYIDDMTRMTVESRIRTPSIFVAWARYDTTHYILGDDYGSLHLLTILTEGVVVTGMEMNLIGKASRASQLVYLGNNMLFVGSHYGDSQLCQLDFAASNAQYVTLQQSIPNIGPVLDFAVMDMGHKEDENQLASEYSSGQARLVTGSGVHRDGSLRSVRSGVGMEDIGIIGEMTNVQRLFSLRSYGSVSDAPQRVDTLVASFSHETRVFRFDSAGDIEEVEEFQGLSLSSQTLLLSELPNSRLLQVTPEAAALLDAESGVVVSGWRPPEGSIISDASANSKWLLLSIGGTSLVSLGINHDQLTVSAETPVSESANDQVACINASPRLPDVGAIGFWATGTVSIIDLATLKPLQGDSLRRNRDNVSVPRDIVLTQVLPPNIGGPTLLVAMDDGNVVTFNVSKTDFELSGRKSVTLGTQQATFHVLPQPNGMDNIFASTEHPSLIYGAEGRIVYAGVTAEDATCVCPFDTESYEGAVAVATDSLIKIARIDTARRTHVRSLEMGETIRRIAYSPTERVFGLGCLKRELVKGAEVITSSFKLVDETVFAQVGKTIDIRSPGGTELIECIVRAELPDAYGNLVERFIVGTSIVANGAVANKNEENRGRILVLGIDSNRDPFLLMTHILKGACRCIAIMDDDKLVTGLSKTVVLSKYEEISSTEARLVRLASYRPATYPMDVAVSGNMIAVADLMKSLAIVEYIPPAEITDEENSGGDVKGKGKGKAPAEKKKKDDAAPLQTETHRLVERCRHYQATWATSVCHLEGDTWLQGDDMGNVQVLDRNSGGVTVEDKRRMDCLSEINLGEMVNKIKPIAVESSPNAMIIPKAFLGTVEGGIYMFGTVAQNAQDLLLRLQSRLESRVQALGGLPFQRFRAFRNAEREAEEPFRFLDGELLERFLDLDEETQIEVCEGLGPDVEAMRGIVEELKRLH